jgi:single-stranded DNA-binding protein
MKLQCKLTGAPELRFTPRGREVCMLYLSDERYPRGEAWGQLAGDIADSWDLKPGTEVGLLGHTKTVRWTTRDGEQRSAVHLVVTVLAYRSAGKRRVLRGESR